jgi:hypothetical protein
VGRWEVQSAAHTCVFAPQCKCGMLFCCEQLLPNRLTDGDSDSALERTQPNDSVLAAAGSYHRVAEHVAFVRSRLCFFMCDCLQHLPDYQITKVGPRAHPVRSHTLTHGVQHSQNTPPELRGPPRGEREAKHALAHCKQTYPR